MRYPRWWWPWPLLGGPGVSVRGCGPRGCMSRCQPGAGSAPAGVSTKSAHQRRLLGAQAIHGRRRGPGMRAAVNVLGTWHVLLATENADAAWVICSSSAQVFGVAEGERLPDNFPVDDAHPVGPCAPTDCQSALPSICARPSPPALGSRPCHCARWPCGNLRSTGRSRSGGVRNPAPNWNPFWEYGAFVDVRDVATAVYAVRFHHRRYRARPGPGCTARPARASHRSGPLPRQSLECPHRLHHGKNRMAARPPLAREPARQAITTIPDASRHSRQQTGNRADRGARRVFSLAVSVT